MSAGTYNINIENGATFELPITYKDSMSAPVDLTGYSIRMQIRKQINATQPLIELTNTNGRIVVTDALAGQFKLSLSADDTDDLQSGVYDIELESGTGFVIRLLEGKVACSKQVTR